MDGLDFSGVDHPCVGLDVFKAAMSEKVCHDSYVRSTLEQVRRKAVSGAVPGYVFVDFRGLCPFPQELCAGGVARKYEYDIFRVRSVLRKDEFQQFHPDGNADLRFCASADLCLGECHQSVVRIQVLELKLSYVAEPHAGV